MANLTGGTAAPSIRMNAAARVLGAPKVVGQKAQRPTPAARPPRMPGQNAPSLPRTQGIGKQQTTQQRTPQHQAAREAAAHKIAGRPPTQKTQGGNAGSIPQQTTSGPKMGLNPLEEFKTGKYADAAEVAAIAKRMTQNEDKADELPYKQQGTEIGSAEQTALARNQALAAAAQPNLQAIQAEGEASAKTGENNAAEAAVAAAKSIETTGQSAATANGGYVAPQVASALGQAGAQAGALGGAASQYQSAMGAGGTSFMTAMRAAAADRASEGATRLQQGYGAAQAKNTTTEDSILGKLVPDQEKRAQELGEEQVKDNVAFRDVNAKEGTVKVDAAKVKAGENEAAGKNKTAENDTNKKDATSEANAIRKDTEALEAQGIKNAGAIAKERIKAAYKLDEANKKAGKLTSGQEKGMNDELSSAFRTVVDDFNSGIPLKELREGFTKGSLPTKVGGKASTEKYPVVHNQLLVQAAIELAYYHRVNAVTAKQLASQGLPTPTVENGNISY